jgi:hypothetical protein
MNVLRKNAALSSSSSQPLLSKKMEYSFSTKDTDVNNLIETYFNI